MPVAVVATAFGITAWAALPLGPGAALGSGAFTAGIPIVDRPEIRSFQRFERGVRTTRPRIILPKRVIEEEAFLAGDYTYCADAPSNIEPREGPYAAAPIPLPYCP
jgi:hypothetical protein